MQSLLITHTQRYHKQRQSGGHVWQGRFKSPVIQDDEHLLTVLRYIEANPLRAGIVKRAADYRWSSYPVHALGDANDLVDRCTVWEELSSRPAVRLRKWAEIVQRPFDEQMLAAVRLSNRTGLPYGEDRWVKRLAEKLQLDLTIRPRGRPKKAIDGSSK